MERNKRAGYGMKEIVVISGKGGTGKTSLLGAFAALSRQKIVLADCDVDAADLHLILRPTIVRQTEFRSGHAAHINVAGCNGCGMCLSLCRYGAVTHDSATPAKVFHIDPIACEGCGVCVQFCPQKTILFEEQVCGAWFVSQTRLGTMVHAKLGIAAENSGKLVTLVRSEAKKIAEEQGAETILIDGSPGTGCPVIASLTAASRALVVTEPTVSGVHDFKRVAALARKMSVPTDVCVNKWDINPETTHAIRSYAEENDIRFVGMVRYDRAVTQAQRAALTLPEYMHDGIVEDIGKVWSEVNR